MRAQIASFVARRWSVSRGDVRVQLRPLRGGLESSVTLATLTTTAADAGVPARLVVKRLAPGCEREATVYRLLARRPAFPTARVFGSERVDGARYLYLEAVRACAAWPWSDTQLGAAVCRVLARLHGSAKLPTHGLAWDYEADLARSAASTLALARSAIDGRGLRCWQRLGDLARVVDTLPQIRAQLAALGTTVIHGDVHPGNVILRRAAPQPQVTFIDWARARTGSPLEDVASWLHSLGCWEPEARRRHDTLLRAYLDAGPTRLTPLWRRCYWFASVSNGLAGAIRYHLAVAANRSAPEPARRDSQRALVAWHRVVRRAAWLISTSRRR